MSDIKITDDELRKLNQSLADLANAVNNGSRSFGPYADEQAAAAAETEAAKERTKAALKQFAEQLGHTAVDFSKSIATGGEGTAKYGTAVEGTTNAIGDLVGKLGFFGSVVGGIIKIFGGLASASLKQNDQLMKSYRELSDMGSVTGSLEKLTEDFHKVGLTVDEYEKFGAMLKGITPQLATFGGSVSEGKDKLLGVVQGMIGPNNQIERAMGRIGYGADEMRDATASYVAQQTKLGLSQNKTSAELRNESVQYMVALRELGELTGLQRDEAQKLLDQQQQDARWAMTLRRIEAEQGHDAMMRAKTAMTAYEARFGKESAGDLMELIANKGAIVGQASARGYMSTMGQNVKAFNDVVSGRIDNEEMLDRTAKGVNSNLNRVGGAFMAMGKAANDFVGSEQMITGAMEQENKKRSDIRGELDKTMADGGKRLNQNIDIEQKNRQMRIAADNALMAVGNVTVGMFQKLNDIMFKFGKLLAKFIDKFGVYVGLGKTNLSEQFRDQDDVAKDLQRAKGKSIHGEQLVHQGVENAAADYKAAMSGTTASLNKQMKEQENLVDSLKAQSKDDKLTPLQRALAEERYKLEKKRYDDMDEEYGASRGFRDLEKVKEMRMKRLNDSMKAEADLKDQIKKLEEEKLKMDQSNTTPASKSAGATGGQTAGGQGGGPLLNSGLTTTITKTDGTKEVREGGTKAWRNNNPGNIRAGDFAMSHGAIGQAGGMAVFPDEATGNKAREALLFGQGSRYADLSLRDAIYRYAPPSENDSEAYLRGVMQATGANAETRLNQLDARQREAMLAQMKQHEGWREGKIHQARTGGIFEGPKSGYPVMLHGKEAVVPMPNIKNFMDDIKKETLAGLDKETKTDTKNSFEMPKIDFSSLEQIMSETLVGKFEDMINQLESANDTLSNLLKHAKA